MSDLVSTGGGLNHPAGCVCPFCTSTAHGEADVSLEGPRHDEVHAPTGTDNLDPRLLELAEHDDPRVLAAVAENKNVSGELLETLDSHHAADPGVHLAVCHNPNVTQDVLDRNCSRYWDGHERHAPPHEVRPPMARAVMLAVAASPNTSEATLDRCSGSKEGAVRLAVAENPNTPASALARLLTERNPRIREQAAASVAQMGGTR